MAAGGKASLGVLSRSSSTSRAWRTDDPFPCFSSMPVITVNYKAPVMTMERQIDLSLLIVAVLNSAGAMGAQISHLIMALPGVDTSTIGT